MRETYRPPGIPGVLLALAQVVTGQAAQRSAVEGGQSHS